MKHRSRKWSMIWGMLAALLLAAFIAVPAYAWPPTDGCQYNPLGQHDWVVISSDAPTCTASGYIYYECTFCGDEYCEEVYASGHSWDGGVVTQAATCTTDGVKTYTCIDCWSTWTEAIPAYGHSWDGGTVTQAATCTTDGVKTYTCYNCGGTWTEAIPATGHSPAYVSGYAATCTEAGLTDGSVCSVCGTVLSAQETIPAFGHSWDSGVITTAATCTTDGVKTYTCSRCGTTWAETIAAYGHSWDGGVVTQAATCTTDGVLTYTCYNCGTTWAETIAATGHFPAYVVGTPATCESNGLTDGYVCSVCGTVLTAQTAIPATGHNWDEGTVIQEPDGFAPGIMQYTCRNNPAHTWTEEINPAPSLFNLLRKGPPGDDNYLYIIEQPQGGAVARYYGSEYPKVLPLTIVVGGGTPPYSYEWHVRETARDEAMTAEKLQGITGASQEVLDEIVDGYNNAKQDWASAWGELYEAIHGEKPQDSDGSSEDPTEVEEAVWKALSANDYAYAVQDTPEFPGRNSNGQGGVGGKTYYCVVTDAEGRRVISDLAEVRNAISCMSEITGTKNMALGDHLLYGNFVDQTEPVSYEWYKHIDTGVMLLVDKTEQIIEVDEPGTYHCIAIDAEGDKATTNEVIMYEAEKLQIVSQSPTQFIRDGHSVDVSIWVTGGVPPYTIGAEFFDEDWNQSDRIYLEGSFEGDDSPYPGSYRYTVTTDQPGTWLFYVNDAMDQPDTLNLSTEIEVVYQQLKIKTQPQGGQMSYNNLFDVNIEMGEGIGPFTYELYQTEYGRGDPNLPIGLLSRAGTWEGDNECTFRIYGEGDYCIIIHDADGRWAQSDWFSVEDYQLHLTLVPEEIDLSENNEFAYLRVFVEGGTEPYTCEWSRYDETLSDYVIIKEEHVSKVNFVLNLDKPGWYSCKVSDKYGVTSSATRKVTYSGTKPMIIVQPEGGVVPNEYMARGYSYGSTTLFCHAEAETGDVSALTYQWQKKTENDWEWLNNKKKTLPLNGDDFGGVYRCVVTNTHTGEQTASEEAVVNLKLLVLDCKRINDEEIVFRFVGGTAPYTAYYWYIDEREDLGWLYWYKNECRIEDQNAIANPPKTIFINYLFSIEDSLGQEIGRLEMYVE